MLEDCSGKGLTSLAATVIMKGDYMTTNQNNGVRWHRWGQVLGIVEAPTEIPVPNQPLPDVKTQIESLEALASELAKSGHDVAEASQILDTLRKMVQAQATSTTDSYNERLNQIRNLLYSAPSRLRFSRTIWPFLLMVFEFLILAFWTFLLLAHRTTFNEALLSTHWSLLFSIFVAAIAGSIGASAFAIYGLYSHLIHRNVHPGYVAWYVARPVVGGVMGAFVGIIGSVLLGGVGATGDGANAFTLGISFLAGSNEKFSAQMIERFTSKVLGVNDTHKEPGAAQPAKQ